MTNPTPPSKYPDLTGIKVGFITVLGFSHTNKKSYWKCQCTCGNIFTTQHNQLTKPKPIQSCGRCNYKERYPREYYLWRHCLGVAGKESLPFHQPWRSFKQFIHDIGESPAYGAGLKLHDPELGYVPENIYWSTERNNRHNTKGTRVRNKTGPSSTKIKKTAVKNLAATLANWRGQS